MASSSQATSAGAAPDLARGRKEKPGVLERVKLAVGGSGGPVRACSPHHTLSDPAGAFPEELQVCRDFAEHLAMNIAIRAPGTEGSSLPDPRKLHQSGVWPLPWPPNPLVLSATGPFTASGLCLIFN